MLGFGVHRELQPAKDSCIKKACDKVEEGMKSKLRIHCKTCCHACLPAARRRNKEHISLHYELAATSGLPLVLITV